MLTERAKCALASTNRNLYNTTTYMSSYRDPLHFMHQSLQAQDDDQDSRSVQFSEHVNSFGVDHSQCVKHDRAEAARAASTVKENNKPSVNDVDNDDIGACGECKRKLLDSQEKEKAVESCSNVGGRADDKGQKFSTLPNGDKNHKKQCSHHPRMTSTYLKARPKTRRKLTNNYECNQMPYSKQSMLKAEAVARRRELSFARRNFSTISLHGLLQREPKGARKQQDVNKIISKESRVRDWNRDFKSVAIKKFHRLFPVDVQIYKTKGES